MEPGEPGNGGAARQEPRTPVALELTRGPWTTWLQALAYKGSISLSYASRQIRGFYLLTAGWTSVRRYLSVKEERLTFSPQHEENYQS